LVKGLEPEKIFLFGSQALDIADKRSDYDLLVVVNNSSLSQRERAVKSYELLWGLTTPIDVVVLTRSEFIQSSQARTSLASIVLRQRRLIYDGS
jgi:predicted nucleotidyltransferase